MVLGGGAIQALVTGTSAVNGTLEAILQVAGRRWSFMGSASQGLPGCWVSGGSIQGRREWGCGFLSSLAFYKICTEIIHKLM